MDNWALVEPAWWWLLVVWSCEAGASTSDHQLAHADPKSASPYTVDGSHIRLTFHQVFIAFRAYIIIIVILCFIIAISDTTAWPACHVMYYSTLVVILPMPC